MRVRCWESITVWRNRLKPGCWSSLRMHVCKFFPYETTGILLKFQGNENRRANAEKLKQIP
jgi:hypothetical protein